MHFNVVKNKINALLRNDILNHAISKKNLPEILSVKSNTDISHIVIDPELCKQVMLSHNFHEYPYSETFNAILSKCRSDSKGLARFFRNSPLEFDGTDESSHRALRKRFKTVYDEVLKTEPKHPQSVSGKIPACEYARIYISNFVDDAFHSILKNRQCYLSIEHISGSDIFDIFTSPAKILSASRAIDEFYQNFPGHDDSIDENIRSTPEAFLTMILMGRDPLQATMTAWLNDLISGGDGTTITYRSVSPTNFVPRICKKQITLGDFYIQPGEALYILIPAANQDSSLANRMGFSFGYGAHFCLGYQFASQILAKFQDTFDRSRVEMLYPSPLKLKNAFYDYEQSTI